MRTLAFRGGSKAQVKQNHHQTMARYTIMTDARDYELALPEDLPTLGITFKTESGEQIRAKLQVPAGMFLQFSPNASFRTCDVVEFLGAGSRLSAG